MEVPARGPSPNLERHRGAGYCFGRASANVLISCRACQCRAGTRPPERATLFSTLLAAFQAALSRWTGAKDILVGTPVANRPKQTMNETMGYFAGIVPLRSSVEPERTFSAGLRALHQTTVECFANVMPFAELARALGDAGAPGHNPIFEVRFALQNHPMPDVELPGLSAKLRMRSTGTARFHLACEITEDAEQLEWCGSTDRNSFPRRRWKTLSASSRMCSPVPAARPKPASAP